MLPTFIYLLMVFGKQYFLCILNYICITISYICICSIVCMFMLMTIFSCMVLGLWWATTTVLPHRNDRVAVDDRVRHCATLTLPPASRQRAQSRSLRSTVVRVAQTKSVFRPSLASCTKICVIARFSVRLNLFYSDTTNHALDRRYPPNSVFRLPLLPRHRASIFLHRQHTHVFLLFTP